jgi:NAD-dependent SIR2 family protein deacetylase
VKSVYFLGAGASASEGAPIQSQLFREYFKLFKYSHDQMDRELATFFGSMFGIDVDCGNLDAAKFPTFEEALGILELADRRNESFRDFQTLNVATNSNRIGFLKLYLILLMARVIAEKLNRPNGYHLQLVKKLQDEGALDSTSFVTSNYDILIDNALASLYPGRTLDYGVTFTNYAQPGDWEPPRPGAVQLLKIHGSLNWLHCPTCNTLTLTPREKGVVGLLTDVANATCRECDTVHAPIIVPPTFFKETGKPFLTAVLWRAEQAMRDADRIVFCGYSMPDSDIHIKYLVKRAQRNRTGPLRIIVCNEHPGKVEAERIEEKTRFERMFGPVDFRRLSFEEVAVVPSESFD